MIWLAGGVIGWLDWQAAGFVMGWRVGRLAGRLVGWSVVLDARSVGGRGGLVGQFLYLFVRVSLCSWRLVGLGRLGWLGRLVCVLGWVQLVGTVGWVGRDGWANGKRQTVVLGGWLAGLGWLGSQSVLFVRWLVGQSVASRRPCYMVARTLMSPKLAGVTGCAVDFRIAMAAGRRADDVLQVMPVVRVWTPTGS